ncbi:FUSC family protein [Streptomyces sp. NPDC051776]|uniref:FUSC family protein n=1 Tax=Streptomyces sp. NPDC051776 TaxID=3155414 RepID=UPI0034407E67
MKTMFAAPDPGLLRLRTSVRAVIGVGLAVIAAELCGLALPASITGGLAALLAFFNVADPTVRRQMVTTVLLPVAGLPVLTLATVLHDRPLLRDAAFLAVVVCGVYARRWGPRGTALGIFAFMMFFATQFLHAVPDRLPQLYVAVLLAVASAGAVRFGWCMERRTPPSAAPAPPLPGRGLARTSTRQAFQCLVACALALGVGQAISDERWYWAVGTAWWIFVNTASRGETMVRGFRRVLGTVAGIGAGLLVAVPLHGAPLPSVLLAAVCVFGIFYTAALSYSWMMFFVTVMAGLLYGLLGVLDPGLLALRFQQTMVGAFAAAIAVTVVLPVTTHASTDAWIQRALLCVRRCTEEATRRSAGDADADPAAPVAELELLLGRVRTSLGPLVHPLSPLRARKARALRVIELLDDCARQVRGLTETAGGPEASRDERLTAACRRVEAAVEGLLARAPERAPVPAAPAAEAHHHHGVERALAHLHALERALAGLAAPLKSHPSAPLPSS